jgi:predicted flap endonuclease-1-like 5' DNA nuclease
VELEQEAADARWQLANRTLELTRVKARCSELESVLAHRAQELVALERRLAEALGQNGTLPSNGRSRTAAVDLSEKATLERTPTPATVSVVTPIDPGRARELPSAPATVPSATVSSVIKSQAAQAQPIRATETQPSSAEAVDESPFPGDVEETPTPSPADVDAVWAEGTEELGLISGINPGIAQTLRAQGVTRLSQIAAWSDDDIRRIAKAIRVPKSRISRGRWVQKAREAMKMASVATSTGSLPREEEAPTSSSGA